MGQYLQEQYEKFILNQQYNEPNYTGSNYGYYYLKPLDNYNFVDKSKYVPRIEGTELEFGITFLDFDYLPIITSRVVENKRNYYLFDFMKVWSIDEKLCTSKSIKVFTLMPESEERKELVNVKSISNHTML